MQVSAMRGQPTPGDMRNTLHAGYLDSALNDAVAKAGGDGGVIVRVRGGAILGLVCSTGLNEAVSDYARGDRPVDSRTLRVNPKLSEGFRLDHDDFSPQQIARDPYYQEFLRKHGLGWHACALLGHLANGDEVHFSIKRRIDRGPFAHAAMEPLALPLQMLRQALAFSEIFTAASQSSLDSSGAARTALVALSPDGVPAVLRQAIGQECLFSIQAGMVALARRADAPRLRRVMEAALAGAPAQNVLLSDATNRRWLLHVASARYAAFAHHAALLTFRSLDHVDELSRDWQQIAQEVFDLTPAEARVADCLRQGSSLREIAQRLLVGEGTIRNHLKAIFAKTGTSRQAQLAAFLSRL